MKKRISLLILLLGCILAVSAEQLVNGVVKDANGEPIIGASVKVSGTSVGTVTDFDGNFSVMAESNSSIEISYLGYVVPSSYSVIRHYL